MSSHHYPPSQQFPPTAYSPYPPQSPNPDAFHYQPPPFQQPLGPTFTQQAPGSSPQTIPDPPTARLQQPPINAQPLTLNVQNVGLPNPGMLITDFHTGATLYHVESPKRSHFSSDPHFTFKSPLTNNGIVGSVRFHSMTADIDVLVHGQKVDFKNSIWSSAHELKSKVPGVGKLTWKSHHVLNGGDMRCTDERKQVVARMEAKRWKEVQKVSHFSLCEWNQGPFFGQRCFGKVNGLSYRADIVPTNRKHTSNSLRA